MAETKLEEARERLERDLELQDGGGIAYTCHDALYTVVVQGEDLRLILAELDRRSPPTGEGEVDRTLFDELMQVFADPYIDLITIRAAREIARLDAALAAAPPPPDVSRGLDREEVARIIALAGLGTTTGNERWIPPTDKWDPAEWHQRVLECVPGDVERRCYETADAIIALSAPAGGGMEVEPQYSSLRSAPQPALGGKPSLDEPENAAGAWRDIASAPRDGTVFVGCSLDHPSFGSWAMYRRVRYSFDDEGNPVAADAGAWAILHDLEPDLQEGFSTGPEALAAIARDDLNTSVRYGWMPLPPAPADTGRGEDPNRTNPDPCAEDEA